MFRYGILVVHSVWRNNESGNYLRTAALDGDAVRLGVQWLLKLTARRAEIGRTRLMSRID